MITHLFGLLANPRKEWLHLRSTAGQSTVEVVILTWLVVALIPPVSLLIGLTQWGWQNLDGTVLHLSMDKAAL